MESSKRIAYWDNFNGVLIFLVVFAHFLYNFPQLHEGRHIVNMIYFFHMPVFVFISGYFSKKEITFSKVLKYLLLYFIFNTIFIVIEIVTNNRILAITPFYSYWYLLALVAWRIIAKYIPCNQWYIMIPTSFIIGLFSGLFADVSNILAIEKILGFLPFFFIGYYLPKDLISSFLEKRKKWVFVVGLFIFLFALLGAFYMSDHFFVQNALLMEPYTIFADIFIRLLIYIIACLAGFGLFCMIPKRTGKYNFIEKWGRNSLWIYVFHRPITLLFASIYQGSNTLYILTSIVISVVLCLVFGSDKLSTFLNQYLDKIVDALNKERISSHLLEDNKSTSK